MNLNLIPLLAAAFAAFFAAPAAADIASGGEYAIEASVVDAGGGEKMAGGEYQAKGSLGQIAIPDNVGLSVGGEYVNREGFYNPPHLTFQKGLAAVMRMPSGDISVTLPPASVDKERFDITMNRDSLLSPMAVDPGKIDEANSKIVHNEGPWSQLSPGTLAEMSIFDEQDLYLKPLANPGVLTMRYQDANNDGILDGSNPPVRVDTLNTWTLDQTRNMWVRLPEVGADPATRTLSVYFGMPGVYAVIGAIDDSVRDVYAFPVPFRPHGPQAGTNQGQTGTEAGGITFTSVPQNGRIEIYTLDGRLVRKISIPSTLIIPEVVWDVRTASGEKVASGVYIWRVVSGSNSKTGKLMVIW